MLVLSYYSVLYCDAWFHCFLIQVCICICLIDFLRNSCYECVVDRHITVGCRNENGLQRLQQQQQCCIYTDDLFVRIQILRSLHVIADARILAWIPSVILSLCHIRLGTQATRLSILSVRIIALNSYDCDESNRCSPLPFGTRHYNRYHCNQPQFSIICCIFVVFMFKRGPVGCSLVKLAEIYWLCIKQ